MATIREVYFSKLPIIEGSKNFSVTILRMLLIKFNGFKDELELSLKFDSEMKNEKLFDNAFKEILNGKMFEYLINESKFCGNTFYVDENVLIPRQETEEVVNSFYEYFNKLGFNPDNIKIADVCTGSGCIGISIKKKILNAKVYLTDIDEKALGVARKNVLSNNVECDILMGDMLRPLVDKKVKLDSIICNPPYISNVKGIDKRTWDQEPHKALLAEPCTKYYESLLSDAKKVLKNKYLIVFEIGEDMKKDMTNLVKKYLPEAKYKFEKDLDGKWRVMIIYNHMPTSKAARTLLSHGVIGFPTETVMGLGVIYDDKKAFEKLNSIKRRPENKPYSLMLSDVGEITKYAYLSNDELTVAKKFLPGPLTLLLKKKRLPKWVTLGSEYVGIRVPDIQPIRKIIKATGKPILAPSANRSGENPALTNKDLKKMFGNELDYIVKGDALNSQPSTIVLINKDVKIIREGPISKQQILEVLENENCNRK